MNEDQDLNEQIGQAKQDIAGYQMETSISAFGNACQLESRGKTEAALKQVFACALAALAATEFQPNIQVILPPVLKELSPKLCAQLDDYIELAAKMWPFIHDRCLEIYKRGSGLSISDN